MRLLTQILFLCNAGFAVMHLVLSIVGPDVDVTRHLLWATIDLILCLMLGNVMRDNRI